MTDKEIQEVAHKIIKEVSMLPDLSEYEAMMLCATKALRYNKTLDSKQGEPKSKFEQSIQEGDNIVYNEDLGCRVNLSLLDRVAKKEKPVSIWHDASEETPTSGSNILMVRKKEEDTNYPPIAGCFHGTNSRLDGRNWGYYNGFCYNEIEPPVKWAYIDDILNLSNVERTGKNWKEPVSEDLDSFAIKYAQDKPYPVTVCQAVRVGANWQKQQMIAKAVDGTTKFVGEGAEKMVKFVCANLNPDEYGLNQRVKLIII